MAKNNVTTIDPDDLLEDGLAAEMLAAGIDPDFVRRVDLLERQAAIGLLMHTAIEMHESSMRTVARLSSNAPMLASVLGDFRRKAS